MFQFSFLLFLLVVTSQFFANPAKADENLFGYIRGAEPLPMGHWEFYQILTSRTDKGQGTYRALDSETEIEYGLTDRLSLIGAVKMQSIYVRDLVIDAYIPKDIDYGLKLSGLDFAAKYNFLSAAKDDLGFSTLFAIDHSWLDNHSGQDKSTTSVELEFLLQKYFLEGELIWVTNFGIESTYAQRYHIDGLPADYEWPTDPEMEIELKSGMGLSYRFVPNWFVGAELLYESEYETEVGQERFSTFAGPNLHYGGEHFWSTLTWLPQVDGGGPPYPGQENTNLHLIEKTKQEIRLKIGYNF